MRPPKVGQETWTLPALGPGLPSAVVSGPRLLFSYPSPLHTGLCPGAAPLSTRTRVAVVAPGAAGSPGRGRGCAGPRRPCTRPSPLGPWCPACRARCPAVSVAGPCLLWPPRLPLRAPSLTPPAALRWRDVPTAQLPGLDSRAWTRPVSLCAAFLLPLCRAADRKSTRLNSSHRIASRMPSSA